MPDRESPEPVAGVVAPRAPPARALRNAARLTQREVAAKTNYSHVTILKAEQGLRLPTWEVMKAIIIVCAPQSDLEWWHARWKAARAAPHMVVRPTVGPARRRRAVVIRPGRPSYLPDATEIRTREQYVRALARLRRSPYRAIAQKATLVRSLHGDFYKRVAHSTMADLFRKDRRWLEWDSVKSFLLGCGAEPEEIREWEAVLHSVQGWHRPTPIRRTAPGSAPPHVDLTEVDSAAAFVLALKGLRRKANKTVEEVIEDAWRHEGAHIYGRSTVAARFSRGLSHGILPERHLVKAYLRGVYCTTRGFGRCVADCNADELAPWLRLYDGLQRSSAAAALDVNGQPSSAPTR